MATRCKSIAGQKVNLEAGKAIMGGSELVDGSAICNGIEEFPMQFIDSDDCIAGEGGATVIWPDTGNDLVKFDPGEHVPVGTQIYRGQVNDGGQWFGAPHQVENEGAYAGGDEGADGGTDDAGGGEGLCIGKVEELENLEDDDWLAKLSELEIPDLEAFMMTGFTAKVQEIVGKLNEVLGKLTKQVDNLMEQAILTPPDVCTPPVKATIKRLQQILKQIMKILPVMQKIIKVIKIIQKVIKIARKILKWTPPFVVPIIEGLMKILNIMGLVDMCVSLLVKTIGRFSTILPVLYAQLAKLLAQCMNQDDLPTKEECEAAGGEWVDPDELKELEDMYNKIQEETSKMNMDDTDDIGFCSIAEHLTKKECEDAGGVWNNLDADTDFEEVDTSALSGELAKQLEELDRCFADPQLNEYLRGL
tara:strand:+ start:479 stop:1732 length:1254 start_codon:yes stop_codon:yes gene_type:complete